MTTVTISVSPCTAQLPILTCFSFDVSDILEVYIQNKHLRPSNGGPQSLLYSQLKAKLMLMVVKGNKSNLKSSFSQKLKYECSLMINLLFSNPILYHTTNGSAPYPWMNLKNTNELIIKIQRKQSAQMWKQFLIWSNSWIN